MANGIVILAVVRAEACGAILNSGFSKTEIAATMLAKCVQWTIAENAAERIRISSGVAGEILTFPVLEKIKVRHRFPPGFRCISMDV